MKTIEALISAMVLLSFSPLLIMEAPLPQTQLYKYQLAEDVWRVAYLEGCFVQQEPDFSAAAAASGSFNMPKNSEDVVGLLTDGDVLAMIASINSAVEAKDPMESCLNKVVAEIESETALRIEFENMDAAGSERASEDAVRIQKTIIVNGVPETVFLRVG